MPAEGHGIGSLRLELEELSALVAEVGHKPEKEADEREAERRCGRANEREQRAARERILAKLLEERGLRPRLKDVEGRSCERLRELGARAGRRVEP
jgi:hypothetical protein